MARVISRLAACRRRRAARRGAEIVSLGLGVLLVVGLYGCERAPEPLEPLDSAFYSMSPVSVRFATIGDYGEAGPEEEDVANLVKSWNPDFILTLGDNNYEDGEAATIDANIGQYFHEFIHPYTGSYGEGATTNRFWPTLGNHDYHGNNQAEPYLDYFALPGNERYYEFREGPVHFFALNSNRQEPDGETSESVQAEWLKNALAASTAPWKVVYFHHSPFSSGKHGSEKDLQWPFKEWGADIVLSGHDHLYERFNVGGLVYIVNGLGGESRYSFGKVEEGSLVRYNDDYGAQLVEANETTMTLRFYTRTGALIDTYTMTREKTISFQNGASPSAEYAGAADTYLSENSIWANYGSAAILKVDGDDPDGKDKRSLLMWDVSGVPPTATVVGAYITVNVVNVSSHTYELYRVKRSWNEHGASWKRYDSGKGWRKAGADDADSDRGKWALGSIRGSTVGPYTITLNARGLELVQGWVSGRYPNRGVLIMDSRPPNGLEISSSEALDATHRPKLTVIYR